MSVALLSHSKPVEICDELEAFLYVLIYYAARYLKSDCDGATIAIFLDEFFDTLDRKSTRLNSSHSGESRMPSSA